MRHFTAINNIGWWRLSLDFWLKYVSESNHYCLTVCPFHSCFLTLTTWKTVKMAILTVFYGKYDPEWQKLHAIFGMSLSKSQTNTVSLFDNYNSSFWTSKTWKTENSHFYGIYGKKWPWIMTTSLDFWHDHVSESSKYCLTICHL